MGLSAEYAARPAAEETINDPTNNRHYWRYRMHVGLEDLLADGALLATLQVRRLVIAPRSFFLYRERLSGEPSEVGKSP